MLTEKQIAEDFFAANPNSNYAILPNKIYERNGNEYQRKYEPLNLSEPMPAVWHWRRQK